MAKLRGAQAYRRIKRAYTRKSKYKKKSFVKGVPGSKIVSFDSGNLSKKFPFQVDLVAKKEVNLRHNAIEAARQSTIRHLSAKLGKQGYAFKIRAFPHHIMREHPIAGGAGADRFQQGMKKSFGKPYGLSAHVKPGKVIFTIFIDEAEVIFAGEVLKKASHKFPIACSIQSQKL